MSKKTLPLLENNATHGSLEERRGRYAVHVDGVSTGRACKRVSKPARGRLEHEFYE